MLVAESIPRLQADAAWKDVLEFFLKDIIEMAFPDLFAIIDWTRGWTFLDKELGEISLSDTAGTRFVDKLVKIYLLDGNEKWLLIHIEVQGRKEDKFPERMFIYGYRIYDKYKVHPVSCAILTDGSLHWRPTSYEYRHPGCEITFKFRMLKLLDL